MKRFLLIIAMAVAMQAAAQTTPLHSLMDQIAALPQAKVLSQRSEQIPPGDKKYSTLNERILSLPYKSKADRAAVDATLRRLSEAYSTQLKDNNSGIINTVEAGSNIESPQMRLDYPNGVVTCGGRSHSYIFASVPDRQHWNCQTVDGVEWWPENKGREMRVRLVTVFGPNVKLSMTGSTAEAIDPNKEPWKSEIARLQAAAAELQRQAGPALQNISNEGARLQAITQAGDNLIKNIDDLNRMYKNMGQDENIRQSLLSTLKQYFNRAITAQAGDRRAYFQRLFGSMAQFPGYTVELFSPSRGRQQMVTCTFADLTRRMDRLNIATITGIDDSPTAKKKYGKRSENGVVQIYLE